MNNPAPSQSPEPASARRRLPLLIGAGIVVVLAVAAAVAYAVYPREDSGVVACRRLAAVSASGDRPALTLDETREIVDLLAGSGNADLARTGGTYQDMFELLDSGERDTTDVLSGFPASLTLITQTFRACGDAGVEVPTPHLTRK
ncbi:hypothetical protein J2S43_002206 [Catenuloplanes nepalensis]|uniref:Uncharacterized protein n=1 Tax=Catenuloplanes nepalensis TaxID=587533 RepID=A0ABT9MQJ6_9ACTN|nr:hypothetical protein [Catenuloplanes nepalensis]MDP9793694.1 hypothetical protein [Catenuloplanes nepalensis]